MTRVTHVSQDQINAAAQALRDGDLVAFPTETVYGLGADASNPAAVRKIFTAKGRPSNHPVIVHLEGVVQLSHWAREVPEVAWKLAEHFWPGPLTLVLPRAAQVSDAVTGGQDTIAMRVPSHPVAQQLLRAFGGGIAAPSANRYGRLSPTRAEHVRAELGETVRVILDGGECLVGLESTIVAVESDTLRLLRPGAVTESQLRGFTSRVEVGAAAASPRVPGSTLSHYAPTTPVSLADDIDARAAALSNGGRVAVLALRPPVKPCSGVLWVNAGDEPRQYARNLYANLRALDLAGCDRILVQSVPRGEPWDAIRDRLARAAADTTRS